MLNIFHPKCRLFSEGFYEYEFHLRWQLLELNIELAEDIVKICITTAVVKFTSSKFIDLLDLRTGFKSRNEIKTLE